MSLPLIHKSPSPRPTTASPRSRLVLLLPSLALLALVLAGCTGRDIIGLAEGWTPVAVADGAVYVGSRSGEVLALNSQALDKDERLGPIWKYEPREENRLGSIFGTPAVSDTHVYLGSAHTDAETGRLLALRRDRQSNNQIQSDEWEKTVEGAIVGGPVLDRTAACWSAPKMAASTALTPPTETVFGPTKPKG